jgi:hypothetical protein
MGFWEVNEKKKIKDGASLKDAGHREEGAATCPSPFMYSLFSASCLSQSD